MWVRIRVEPGTHKQGQPRTSLRLRKSDKEQCGRRVGVAFPHTLLSGFSLLPSGAIPIPLRLQLHSGVFYLSPIPQEEVTVETSNPQPNKMDKLMEILNSMRNNSSDVDAKLTSFMEEAQNSTNSEEMLEEIVRTIYQKAVSDRSFAFTAAKLCDKMALFMVEGTKFRSLLLNMLQVTRHQQLLLHSPAPPTGVIARERAASSDGG